MNSEQATVIEGFLAGLPSQHPENFANWNPNRAIRQTRPPSPYIPTKEFPVKQVIVSEKTVNILHALHENFGKQVKKRTVTGTEYSTSTSNQEEEESKRKRPRTDSNLSQQEAGPSQNQGQRQPNQRRRPPSSNLIFEDIDNEPRIEL